MASPDTDELATIPLPAGGPEGGKAQTAPGRPAAPDGAAEAAGSEGGPAVQAEGGQAAADPLDQAETAPQERVEPERIEPDCTAPAASAPVRQGGRWWRGFTGSLAAGLAVLAVGVLAVAGICLFTGAPGPGPTLLIGHPVAAVLALVAQRVADRRNGPAAVGAGVAVVLFTVSALTLFWLA